jgi:hypothetical protein
LTSTNLVIRNSARSSPLLAPLLLLSIELLELRFCAPLAATRFYAPAAIAGFCAPTTINGFYAPAAVTTRRPPQLIKILHSQGSIITWRAATLAGGDQDMRKAPLLTLLMMDLKEESHGDTMGGEPRWRWLPHIWPPGRCSTPFGSPPASYPATTPLLSPPPLIFFRWL